MGSDAVKALFDVLGRMHSNVSDWDVTGCNRHALGVLRGFEWGGLDAPDCIPAGSLRQACSQLQTVVVRGEV
jgi:hypothetical protein